MAPFVSLWNKSGSVAGMSAGLLGSTRQEVGAVRGFYKQNNNLGGLSDG